MAKISDCLKVGNIMRNGQMQPLHYILQPLLNIIRTAMLWFDKGDLDACTVKYNTIRSSACFLLHSSLPFECGCAVLDTNGLNDIYHLAR